MALPILDTFAIGDEVQSHVGDRKPVMSGVIVRKLARGKQQVKTRWVVKWENGHEGNHSPLTLMLKQ
jgi:hypothetical protein